MLLCTLVIAAVRPVAMVLRPVAVVAVLNLPAGRATVLMGYLASASVVSRLVVLGVLSVL